MVRNQFSHSIRNLTVLLILSAFLAQYISCTNISLNPDEFTEVLITNDFLKGETYVKTSGESLLEDSVQVSPNIYASVVRGNSDPGDLLLAFVDENGKQISRKKFNLNGYYKNSLSATNVEGEVFLAYTQFDRSRNERMVYYVFLDQNNFTRGTGFQALSPFIKKRKYDFHNLITKCSTQYCYIVQQNLSPLHLYLTIIDIKDHLTQVITYRDLFTTNVYRSNLFSIQAFSDGYLVVFARDQYDRLERFSVKSDGQQSLDSQGHIGPFMDLKQNSNSIQNKIIKVPDADKDYHTLVTADKQDNIFSIYTFEYKQEGKIEQKCFSSYENLIKNVGNRFFYSLEFGVINSDLLWIKGDHDDSKKSILFFANPVTCEVYRDIENQVIKYEFQSFSQSHLFHTYLEQGYQIIAASSQLSQSNSQKMQVVKIGFEYTMCSQYCATCTKEGQCLTCIESNVRRDTANQCQCPRGYSQDDEYESDCIADPFSWFPF